MLDGVCGYNLLLNLYVVCMTPMSSVLRLEVVLGWSEVAGFSFTSTSVPAAEGKVEGIC